MTHPVTNLVFFQLCWLANCAGAGAGWPELGPLLTGFWILLHLSAMSEGRGTEVRILLSAATLGYAADSLLVLLDFIEFPAHARLGGPSPLWMVALWVGFAATLRHALRWLQSRYVLGALLGAVGGPLAYRAGEALGAISIREGLTGLAAVSVEWLLAMPALLALVVLIDTRNRLAPSRSENRTEHSC